MIEKDIEQLAYKLKQNNLKKRPGAVVFIGAGCSVSAGIPVSKGIVKCVREKYKDNPTIDRCKSDAYADIMECLDPQERKDVFTSYVNTAKINVSHIYLAQLISESYVDYVVTVNFDNLAIRALALYERFPAIYDISTLKDLTTTPLETKSITFLHGMYNGLWQLNTKAEMAKIIKNGVVRRIFSQITINRPWIVVGYDGSDFIFDELVSLGRFDNGLYWIAFEDYVSQRVSDELLNRENTESFVIKGYDADLFFLKLSAKLQEDEPQIFTKPFTLLYKMMQNVVDIKDSEDYKSVKERLELSKKMVSDAIANYELIEQPAIKMSEQEIKMAKLNMSLIDCLTKEQFEKLTNLELQLNEDNTDENTKKILSDIYISWGNNIFKKATLADESEKLDLYNAAKEKFIRAVQINEKMYVAYNNWGAVLNATGTLIQGAESERYFNEAIDKYKVSLSIKEDYVRALYNYARSLYNLGKLKPLEEAANLYNEAINKLELSDQIQPGNFDVIFFWALILGALAKTSSELAKMDYLRQAASKYSLAIGIKNDSFAAYYNWGLVLSNIASNSPEQDREPIYNQSFDKFQRAIDINPNYFEAHMEMGYVCDRLAEIKPKADRELLYYKSIENYKKAIAIDISNRNAYYNLGYSLLKLAQLKNGEESMSIFVEAETVLIKAEELGATSYNLACLYALTNRNELALSKLDSVLEKDQEKFSYVEKDSDWDALRNEPKYLELKAKYLN